MMTVYDAKAVFASRDFFRTFLDVRIGGSGNSSAARNSLEQAIAVFFISAPATKTAHWRILIEQPRLIHSARLQERSGLHVWHFLGNDNPLCRWQQRLPASLQ